MFKQIPTFIKLLVFLFVISVVFTVAGFSMSDEDTPSKGEKIFKACL